MNDKYRDGFERLLSDMDAAPSWRQVSTQRVAPTPAPTRAQRQGRGLLVAGAAIVATILVIGAVVLIPGGGLSPVAADTIDYVKLSWSQEVEMRCVDMEIVDNDGFDSATIEIWGPNADGLVRVDVTAPDGTVDRLIADYTPENLTEGRVWRAFAGSATHRDRMSAYQITECVEEFSGGSNCHILAESSLTADLYHLGFFTAIPDTTLDGAPWDFMADLTDRSNTLRSDQWRGIPVTVFALADIGDDPEIGTVESISEIWLDAATGRYERTTEFHDAERLGTLATKFEVVERATVPALSQLPRYSRRTSGSPMPHRSGPTRPASCRTLPWSGQTT